MGKKNCENKQEVDNIQVSTKKIANTEIKIMFSNCDTLTNKMEEFQATIDLSDPDIISLNEVKPKHCRDITKEEFKIIGYDIIPHENITQMNIGRRTMLYAKSHLNATQIDVCSGAKGFEEVVFSKIWLGKDTELLVGCFYRSISGTKDNNEVLISIIKAISVEKYKKHFIDGRLQLSRYKLDRLDM